LTGGRLSQVARVGDTVRRTAGPWTPGVHALLRHLRERGFDLAPDPLGIDDRGREILGYVEGDTVALGDWWPAWVWSEQLMVDVAAATARFHQAVADFRPTGPVRWQFETSTVGAGQVVCHNDIAPYNVVALDGNLRCIIDWDLASPAAPLSDLAFVAWQWTPLHHPRVTRAFGGPDTTELGRRLAILLDAYGLDDHTDFVEAVIERIRLNRDAMVLRAHQGVPGYRQLVAEHHVTAMDATIDFVDAMRTELERGL
jgi:aminoglycoside phosphotransferase (APT) family kinase protein